MREIPHEHSKATRAGTDDALERSLRESTAPSCCEICLGASAGRTVEMCKRCWAFSHLDCQEQFLGRHGFSHQCAPPAPDQAAVAALRSTSKRLLRRQRFLFAIPQVSAPRPQGQRTLRLRAELAATSFLDHLLYLWERCVRKHRAIVSVACPNILPAPETRATSSARSAEPRSATTSSSA